MEVFSLSSPKMLKANYRTNNWKRLNRLAMMTLGVAAAVLPVAAQDKPDKEQKHSNKSVGFILSGDATAKDVGLPVYPGAQRRKDTSDDSSALQMGLWGGNSGFKLALLKLDSDDSPEKVAAFYRKALAKYGKVLDCKKSDAKTEKDSENSSREITCQDDQPVAGGFTLKSGTKERQHIVGIEPRGSHSTISLVYLEAPKSESKKD
jgi:hypothetical protein